MLINPNSQLGLRFSDKTVKAECLKIHADSLQKKIAVYGSRVDELQNWINRYEKYVGTDWNNLSQEDAEDLLTEEARVKNLVKNSTMKENFDGQESIDDSKCFIDDLCLNDKGKYFLICESVYKAAELIKVTTGFTGRALKTIKQGLYIYLLGKNTMLRFSVRRNLLRAIYTDIVAKETLEFGVDLETGGYFFDESKDNIFTRMMQLLIFVELGDIEVTELSGGRNNGAARSGGKITNQSRNTVYVVDSTWNKILIRTDGFAVRGHFRLQPYGEGMKDRKLMWIHAFEKHGYKRSPKAHIVKNV